MAWRDNAVIKKMLALDAERVRQLERMLALDADRVKTIERLSRNYTQADGLTALGRNLSFLEEPGFKSAWQKSEAANKEGWPNGVPDVRWRAHIALWAARNGLKLQGDFVEFGVHTGLLSLVICHALDFALLKRKFYLFDTFNGIPTEGLEADELERAATSNREYYRDVWQFACRNFAPFPNAQLVRGALPDSLSQVSIDQIAYMSVDLNNAHAERAVITSMWDKLTPGAIVVVDDYAWEGCERQYAMWNDFARQVDLDIVALPTGQGLLIKPVQG